MAQVLQPKHNQIHYILSTNLHIQSLSDPLFQNICDHVVTDI